MPIKDQPVGFKAGQQLPPDQVRTRIRQYADAKSMGPGAAPVNDSTNRALMSAFNLLLGHVHDWQMRNKERYRLLKYFFGVVSSTELSQSQAQALLNWMIAHGSDTWEPRLKARQEAIAILNMLDEEAGQLKLL